MRYLGIDYGSKRVGLALSDESGTMGFPHSIVENTPRLSDQICALIAQENVGAVVLGDSKNFSGEENAIAKDAKELGDFIAEHAGTPIFYESEVYSTAEARRQHETSEKSRSPKKKTNVDDSAAAIILNSYLSRTNHG